MAAAGTLVAVAGPAHAATSITLNGSSSGRTFDGVGAISGGGGNSRLLIDYPESARSQILDYLFKPGYGAATQILKIEIGGDTNSTSGAEPSIEHTRGVIDCNVGYEFWLAEQAKARNPNIKLYGLAWGAPGWIGGGNFWSTDMINYLVSWLGCAKQNGLTIDYLGGWNERGYNISWYEQLRSALNANGYASVQVVGADSDWTIANDIDGNSSFASAVNILGAHYPCGYLSAESNCSVPSAATSSGKQLWASENGSQDYNGGAAATARGINRGYIDGKMTAYINWPVVAAITPNLPWATTGLVLSPQPWSGYYSVGKQAWVMAQTTQFTAPGWHYLDASSGYIGGNRSSGSYVTLKSTDNTDYSTVIETMDATSAQTLNFNVTGGLSTGAVHVWSTNVNSNNSADYMVHASDITPSGGNFSLTVQPGYVYTITTTTGQGKGTAASGGQGGMSLPYSDSFDSYATGSEAKYLMDWQGAFEVAGCGGGRSGQCVRQMSAQAAITWDTLSDPHALLGDTGWRDYTVSSDVMLEKSGYVEVIGHAGTQSYSGAAGLNAYHLRVSDTGAWSILSSNTSNNISTLASGTTTALGTGRWHTLALTFSGSTITAKLDGATLGTANNSTWTTGQVGYATSQGETAQFDNLSVGNGTVNTVTVTNPGAQTGSVGTAISGLQVHASDSAAGQALTYSASGLPAGLSINASSGLITGTPTAAGATNVTVTAKDSTGVSGSASFTWTISGGTGNTVTVTNPGAQSGTVGTAINSLQIQATDSASGQSLTYSASGLPAGLSINSSGLISGTPTVAGTSNVTVTATDSTGASGSAAFTWTISGGTGGGTCHVSYVKNEWGGGFTANLTVTNTGTTTVNGWTVTWSFPGDQKITNAWNANVTQSGSAVTATNASYNATIAPGGNAQFGFQGTWNSNDTSPTAFTLNGTACS
jgi:glycosyl hydrolase family 59/cellulose binding protein with CBM2 domain/putative Ig domain-containing protein/glycosyl hydrolase family 59 (putative galactocerebrosidase)